MISLGVLSLATGEFHVRFRCCAFAVAKEGCGPDSTVENIDNPGRREVIRDVRACS